MSILLKSFLIMISIATYASGKIPEPASVKFAWLTDIHVGSSMGETDLRTVVSDIRNDSEIDFVIVSGDITEMEIGNHLNIAKGLLDSMNTPYSIIPGNHDTKWSASAGNKFKALWGDDRFNYEYGEYRFIGVHQGPVLRMGNGYIDPQDLAWVDSILQQMPNPRQKIFIVLHYPLNPSIDNWYALRDLIRPYNIQAVLHGHGHSNRVQSFEGIPGVMSRSTLAKRQLSSGYSVVELKEQVAIVSERLPGLDSLIHWHTLALGDHHFADSLLLPMPDFSENDTSGVTMGWQFTTGSIITSAPVVRKSEVFITTTAGDVYCLDFSTGQKLWQNSVSNSIHSTPAIKGRRLVFGSVDSSIYCLSTKDGSLIWRQETNGPILGSPLIHKNHVYIGGGNGIFRSLNLRSGKINWSNTDISAYIETKPIIAGNTVMFGAWDGGFYGLSRKNGTSSWKWMEGRKGPLYSPAACWPVVANGKVFIVAPDRAMSAIDIKNGQNVWRKLGHKVRETIGISEDGNTVFARTMQDSVIAINTSSNTFSLKWISHAGFGYDFAPSSIVEKGGYLYFGTKDGRVYCLDSKSGQVLWHHRVSESLVNTVAIADDQSIVVAAADGNVSLLYFQE